MMIHLPENFQLVIVPAKLAPQTTRADNSRFVWRIRESADESKGNVQWYNNDAAIVIEKEFISF